MVKHQTSHQPNSFCFLVLQDSNVTSLPSIRVLYLDSDGARAHISGNGRKESGIAARIHIQTVSAGTVAPFQWLI